MSKKKVTRAKSLPTRVQLPSRRVLALRTPKIADAPLRRAEGEALFAEVLLAEARGYVELVDGKDKVPCASLILSDFHAVRALLTAASVLHEEPVTMHCKNCDATMDVEPCKELPLGPFRDAELSDDELDATLTFGEPHSIAPIRLGGARVARTVTFAPRTAGESQSLFAALARKDLAIDRIFVHGMGIARLGAEVDEDQIAIALTAATDAAFGSVTNRYLESHYPLRLGAVVMCEACGARNDVDAPYQRELDVVPEHPPEERRDGVVLPSAFPSFDEFATSAHAVFQRYVLPFQEGSIDLIIDDEVPACDDGGEPLLGSYVPGAYSGFDASDAIGARPTVTLYVRTFRAMWNEEGPYDVDAEIDDTIEHELEHHGHYLSGHDQVDEDERALIAKEAERVIGKKELVRVATRGLFRDVQELMRRTWLLWVLVLAALLFAFLRNPQ
jgi:hypothetical protein